MTMRIALNMDRINDAGMKAVVETVPVVAARFGEYGALMSVSLPSKSVLLAMPISSINPLAPPVLQIRGKPNYSQDNRSSVRKIVNTLRPACRSKHLPDAVKMIKSAIERLSTPIISSSHGSHKRIGY